MYKFVAICAKGAEIQLQKEIKCHDAEPIATAPTLVKFNASLVMAYRFLIGSRIATRVGAVISESVATHLDELIDEFSSIPWSDHLKPGQAFSLKCSFTKDTEEAEFRVVKILSRYLRDYFLDQGLEPPVYDPNALPLVIHLLWKKGDLMICIDFSGQSLHRRGYRDKAGEASLKETLAASIVGASEMGASEMPKALNWVLDPCCGAGTLLIEAAGIWAGLPANLNHKYFSCTLWEQHDSKLWSQVLSEARAAQKIGLAKPWPKFMGFDADPKMIQIATKNIEAAGLAEKIHVERKTFNQLDVPHLNASGEGLLIANPPYGERMGDPSVLRYFYQAIGDKLSQLTQAQCTLMSSNIDCLDAVKLSYVTQHKFYNGPLPLFVRNYVIAENSSEKNAVTTEVTTKQTSTNKKSRYPLTCLEPKKTQDLLEQSLIPELSNRLHKNFRKLKSWLKNPLTQELKILLSSGNKEVSDLLNIHSYRIYDADIPEYNFAIDLYEHFIHVQEYKAPKSIDEAKAKSRLLSALETIEKVFAVPSHRVILKQRRQQKKNDQYLQNNQSKIFFSILEWDARLLVNLTDYLDTGVFLDHRNLRLYFRHNAEGKHFLNLFSYTATASLHAALGGAKTTTSVDLSPAYTEWAEKNFLLNGLSTHQHHLICADVIQWLEHSSHTYDMIFVDPPTFSNSKRAEDFIVQDQHKSLIQRCMKRLTPSGELFFSCNFKKFKLDETLNLLFKVEEISRLTGSPDYSRQNSNQHKCWRIQHLR